MELLKILRLRDGEDIIAYVEDYGKGQIVLRSPMMVMIKHDPRNGKQTVLMDHWLPINIIQENEATINEHEILCSFDPTADISEYYIQAISAIDQYNLNSTQSSNDDELTEQEINVLMESNLMGSNQIH